MGLPAGADGAATGSGAWSTVGKGGRRLYPSDPGGSVIEAHQPPPRPAGS